MVIFLLCEMVFSDQVMLTAEEFRLDFQLQSLQWKKILTDAEKEKIISALTSDKDPIVRSALKDVAIHGIKDAVPVLRKGIGVSDIDLNFFAKLSADAIDSNQGLAIQMENMTFPNEVVERDRKKIKENINWVEVVRETKSIREGSKPTSKLDKLNLTKMEKMLIEDANKKEDVTINKIIDTMSVAAIAGGDQYDLVTVLRTYEPNSVQAVMQKLSNKEQVKNISLYGRVLLLSLLDLSIYTMPVEDRNRCKIIFEHFLKDEQQVNRCAFWAIEHIKQLEALEVSENHKNNFQ